MFKGFLEFLRVRRERRLIRRYIAAGSEFGDAVSYIAMGEAIGFDAMLARWERLEKQYSALGFRTISLDAFIGYGGYGEKLSGIGVKRNAEEEPVLHAAIYRQRYADRFEPVIDFAALAKGETQVGTYTLPSTL